MGRDEWWEVEFHIAEARAAKHRRVRLLFNGGNATLEHRYIFQPVALQHL